ncbi:MAG: hypothetical protein DHS20C21_15040 [Gemmatimonadota bacterium]|nr:MAG: hypothetical protein DHS20C21_15040 [Gemmatimonadota bacterium]
MFSTHEPEVLVVGAGPVGLLSALCLDEESIRVQIIDKERRPASHSYALALHPRSLQVLADLGIDPESIDQTARVDTVAFYDSAGRRSEMKLGDLPVRYPYALVIRQSRLEQLLEHELARRKIHVDWCHRLSEWTDTGTELSATIEKVDAVSTGYAVQVSESQVVSRISRRPRFILGADGHHSIVRRRLGIDCETHGDPQVFGVFEFDSEAEPRNEIRVVLEHGRTNVLWPLPDGRARWSFQVETQGSAGEFRHKSRLAVQVGPDYFPHLTPELLQDLVGTRAPWFGAADGTVYWSVLARFERRLAHRYGDGRAWLAGDSAHLTGPVGVQSMNVGLLEARDLTRRMANCHRGQESLETFDAYDRRQREVWSRLLGTDRSARPTEKAAQWVKEHWGEMVPCIPATGSEFCQLAAQVGLQYEEEGACDSPSPEAR